MLCSKCSSEIPNDSIVCPICKTPTFTSNGGVAKLKIVKIKPRPFLKRKEIVPYEGRDALFPYKIHVKVDDKEYVSSKPSMEIPIVPGKRKIKMSHRSFKFAVVQNFVGDIMSNTGDRDAFWVGQFIQQNAAEVLSIEGADIQFEENMTLVVYVWYNGYSLYIADVEEE